MVAAVVEEVAERAAAPVVDMDMEVEVEVEVTISVSEAVVEAGSRIWATRATSTRYCRCPVHN